MSSRRPILVLASVFVPFVFGLSWAGVATARPSYATSAGNSCSGCHTTPESGRLQIDGTDGVLDLGTQLDGNTRGALQLFKVVPGNTVTLSMQVLSWDGVFAVQFKRLEKSGQQSSLTNFLSWLEDNVPGNTWTLQEVSNPPYYTKDDGSDGGLPASSAGPFSFDLFIDPATPPDVYDLEFAIGGVNTNSDLIYQDQHFYLEVVPEPALGASALTMLASLGAVYASRRRLGPS